MKYLKDLIHQIHLTGFTFIFGNMIMDTFFGRRNLEKDQIPLISKLYLYSWLSLIITGIINIVLISKKHNYKPDKNYGRWINILIFKTVLTIIEAFFVEIIAKLIFPESHRRKYLKYLRTTLFFVLMFVGAYSRGFRENELIERQQLVKIKKIAESKKEQ